MAQIIAFTGTSRLPDDPSDALEKAKKWDMERVVICGWKKDGGFVMGGSHSEVGEAALLLDIAKIKLLQVVEEQV